MTALLPHSISWVTAAPLWKGALQAQEFLRRPSILGFGHDGFMDELLATLARSPEKIRDRVATGPSRSYRDRLPGEAYGAQPVVAANALKLYQPAHGWFYLVTGSLVCQLPGLPDHPVDAAVEETASFVVRRLDGGGELALVTGAAGKSWKSAGSEDQAAVLLDGEETFPLFPLAFQEGPRRRKLLAGLIPTASQELFQSSPLAGDPAPQPPENAPPSPADALESVKLRVLKALDSLKDAPPDQQAEISRFALLDLADFLKFSLTPVMNNLQQGTAVTGAARSLADFLRNEHLPSGKSFATVLEHVLSSNLDAAFPDNLAGVRAGFGDDLHAKIQSALQEANPGALADPPSPPRVGSTFYAARLVYQRPHCPHKKPIVSPRSEAFLLAPFFDPEAPQRPIRISLPIDASIKGLRQFKKSVRMVLSQSLRDKTKTPKISDTISGPDLDCGGFELSIPIITIVAMILLFVMISLLNIIFWWIPFVKICLPKIKVEL